MNTVINEPALIKRRVPWIAALATMLVIGGCSGEQYAEKADDIVDVPDRYGAVTLESAPRDGWCSDFGAPELDTLVDQALDRNLDLRAAWARLEQAEAVAEQAESNLYPTLSFQASGGRTKTFSPPPINSFESNNYQLSAPAAYEIDLFGRLAAQRSAASYDARAARADVETFAMSIAAQVAEAWFDAVRQRQKIALFEEQIGISEKYLELTKLRLAHGSSSALDVNQQHGEIKRLKGQLALAKAQHQVAELRLAVLVGQPPSAEQSMTSASELPAIMAFPEVGVPGEVLENRPDVRSARMRLEAADERTAVAAKAFLPSLRLSANVLYQARELGALFDEIFWSFAATATQSVFEGGRRNAALDQAEAAGRERLYTYGQTVLTALQEVETAIVQETRQAEFVEELEGQRELAAVSLDLARERYRSGALDYLRVLTALQSLQTIEQNLIDARRQQLSNRVQTCRALGGDWTRSLEPPAEEGEE